ncbi:procollagen-proline dioxygenase [Nitzschia inconspicua]|uniref:Procollagen-proline dioxygenase n=1 Tax=Nitzschia inconspicua TaxID=303405 RepID=A0A9K3KJ72_9STRA|nr:procollagen-proline dioxygenase [Nitzschia inconspicua]
MAGNPLERIEQQQQQHFENSGWAVGDVPVSSAPAANYRFDPISGSLMVSNGTAVPLTVMVDPQQQQYLLHLLSQRLQHQPVPVTVQSPVQPIVVPIPALQQALLISPTTGAVLGIQPLVATTFTTSMVQQPQPQQHPIVGPAPPPHIIHNLIPEHLQASALAPSHNGASTCFDCITTASSGTCRGQQFTAEQFATMSPVLTVQDRPASIPVIYNGVNTNFPGIHQVHQNPPVYIVDQFLSHVECDFLVHAAEGSWTPAPVVGKGIGEISPSRTSSTCYLAREDLPDYMRKVSLLTSKPVVHCELPQVGRYLPSQQYLHHFDAFDLSNEDGRRFAANGGQRVVTVLVYLNDCEQGGQTEFPAMNLQVSPRKGTALVFFPATVDGYLDKMALHAALPAIDTKYVSQVWIRQGNYYGQPSKRLPNTLGVPFDTNGKEDAMLGVQTAT